MTGCSGYDNAWDVAVNRLSVWMSESPVPPLHSRFSRPIEVIETGDRNSRGLPNLDQQLEHQEALVLRLVLLVVLDRGAGAAVRGQDQHPGSSCKRASRRLASDLNSLLSRPLLSAIVRFPPDTLVCHWTNGPRSLRSCC